MLTTTTTASSSNNSTDTYTSNSNPSGFVITKTNKVFTETVTLSDLVVAYRNDLKLWSIPGSTSTYWDSQPESPYDVVALDPCNCHMSSSTLLPVLASLKPTEHEYKTWEHLQGKRKVYLEIPFLAVLNNNSLL